ncbi:MAG: serine hydrolase [Desulfobacterales bacterium]|nr:serine hydrolase [Desulfobacterales bacterium]MBL7102383.1 serine hydrolase [Desulfobacteraceae bacterium]
MLKDRVKALLDNGITEGVYPGAVLLVAREGKIRFFQECGNRTLVPHAVPMEKNTIFDLASLTKPFATALAMMKLVDAGKVGLDEPLEDLLPKAAPNDKKTITPRLLLSHSAGFVDWKPFYLELDAMPREKRKGRLREELLNIPLAYPPGKGTLYSDLGFMLLEWVIEECAGGSLPRFVEQEFYGPLLLNETFFFSRDLPAPFDQDRFAATEDCPWRNRIIQGAVHDENAYALGGYSGHAGLFGTAKEVHVLVNLLREHWRGEREDYLKPETVRTFFTRQDLVEESTWALGWDTPSPENSSSGNRFAARSIGHLGFTGTSVWIDLERDVIVVFLTNRVHPTRKNEKIRAFRPALHDRVMEELGIVR